MPIPPALKKKTKIFKEIKNSQIFVSSTLGTKVQKPNANENEIFSIAFHSQEHDSR